MMLVDDNRCRLQALQAALVEAGQDVVVRLGGTDDLLQAIEQHQPDVILIDTEAPERDTLESLNRVSEEQPRPIVMFSDNGDPEAIRRAIRAGVSAYVVDGLVASRLKSLIEVAIAQFERYQELKREVDDAKAKLTDRSDVNRAKQVLMRRSKLTETQAYERLRRLAMDQKLKLGDVARAVLAISGDDE